LDLFIFSDILPSIIVPGHNGLAREDNKWYKIEIAGIRAGLQNDIKDTFLSQLSQTSFGHISINSLTILTVLMATESPQKDLLIDTSNISKQSIMAEILGRSTSNHYSTVY